MNRKLLATIMVINAVLLFGCDPSRVIMFNDSKSSDTFSCASKKVDLLMKKGLSDSDILMASGVSKQDTFLIRSFSINATNYPIEVQKEDGYTLFYSKGIRFNKSDTLKISLSFNGCEFDREYILGDIKKITRRNYIQDNN